jgi:serine/threonine protein phosphatase PrpC
MLLEAIPAGAAPAAVARSLTEFALARGGRDNITVAVVEIEPS